jgi:hypothetical protein
MWKTIDKDVITNGLKIGQIISENSEQDKAFKIVEIKKNGNITAAKTGVINYKIIFPKEELINLNWRVLE